VMVRLFLLLLLSLGLAACSTPPAPADVPTEAPAAADATPAAPASAPAGPPLPAAVPGTATVGGRILSSVDNSPLVYVRVAFAEVIRAGDEYIYFDDPVDTPAAEADEQGYFVIAEIPPGEYLIIVGDPMGSNVAATEADGQTPLFVTLAAGEQRQFGELLINLAP
jgi:hypothetical protein